MIYFDLIYIPAWLALALFLNLDLGLSRCLLPWHELVWQLHDDISRALEWALRGESCDLGDCALWHKVCMTCGTDELGWLTCVFLILELFPR